MSERIASAPVDEVNKGFIAHADGTYTLLGDDVSITIGPVIVQGARVGLSLDDMGAVAQIQNPNAIKEDQ